MSLDPLKFAVQIEDKVSSQLDAIKQKLATLGDVNIKVKIDNMSELSQQIKTAVGKFEGFNLQLPDFGKIIAGASNVGKEIKNTAKETEAVAKAEANLANAKKAHTEAQKQLNNAVAAQANASNAQKVLDFVSLPKETKDRINKLKNMLASPEGCSQAVSQIVNELTVDYKALGHNPYSGVTIDFEGLRAGQKDAFTAFLKDLSAALKPLGKTLYVCVSPTLTSGPYFDGYDYHAIGEAADLVILMAYDYDARNLQDFVGTAYYKTAAAAPIDQVYMSLRSVTDPETGVADPGKVLMGFSCKNVAWKIDEAGNLLSGTPVYPSNDTVAKRLAQEDTIHGWSDTYGMPYAIYTADGDTYFLWYEDARSTALKQDTAKLFGLSGVSLWRLGTIPDYDSWNWSELLK